jgi:hypothetical protein
MKYLPIFILLAGLCSHPFCAYSQPKKVQPQAEMSPDDSDSSEESIYTQVPDIEAFAQED